MEIHTVEDLVDAIQRLAIRGAPALGAAGALGAAMAVRDEPARRDRDLAALRAARPTAVNLAWGVDQALARHAGRPGRRARRGARRSSSPTSCATARSASAARDWLAERVRRARSSCRRTATRARSPASSGAPRSASCGPCTSGGRLGHVYVDETRPLLQGARLTAWELAEHGRRPHARRRLGGRDRAGQGTRGRGGRRRGPDHRERRRGQQDRHLPAGTGRRAGRRAVPRGRAGVDDRPGASRAGADVEIEVRDGREVLASAGCPDTPTLNSRSTSRRPTW